MEKEKFLRYKSHMLLNRSDHILLDDIMALWMLQDIQAIWPGAFSLGSKWMVFWISSYVEGSCPWLSQSQSVESNASGYPPSGADLVFSF